MTFIPSISGSSVIHASWYKSTAQYGSFSEILICPVVTVAGLQRPLRLILAIHTSRIDPLGSVTVSRLHEFPRSSYTFIVGGNAEPLFTSMTMLDALGKPKSLPIDALVFKLSTRVFIVSEANDKSVSQERILLPEYPATRIPVIAIAIIICIGSTTPIRLNRALLTLKEKKDIF